MMYTLINVTQNINFNVIDEYHSSNVNERIIISWPLVTYANDKHHSEESNGEHQEIEQINIVIKEFADIFIELCTQTNIYEYCIKVTDPSKFIRWLYPIPIQYEEQIKREIKIILENGVIERWNSNMSVLKWCLVLK